jgi:hypothetical protein
VAGCFGVEVVLRLLRHSSCCRCYWELHDWILKKYLSKSCTDFFIYYCVYLQREMYDHPRVTLQKVRLRLLFHERSAGKVFVPDIPKRSRENQIEWFEATVIALDISRLGYLAPIFAWGCGYCDEASRL